LPKKKKASAEETPSILHTMAQTEDAQKASQQLSELPDLKQHPDAPKIAGYMLIKPLGRGAYAQVWEAIQLRTRKFVAVKVFTKKSGVHWFFLQREADRLIRLDKHPHIVSLLDADLSGDVPYYVMDLAQEGSLERLVDGPPPGSEDLGVEKVAGWMEEVAQALNYVHAKQMVHCDLKPANVLLDEEGHVRVADFGNSRVLSESGGTLGTLFYMAPEQAVIPDQDSPLQPDVRWDIYALGCTIYSLLANRVPHSEIGEKLEMTPGVEDRLRLYRQAIDSDPLPDLFTLTKGEVDIDLSAIVAKCMAVKPQERYDTVAEVLKDLKARREGRPVSPLAHDKGYWLAKFLLRYRLSVFITAVFLMLLSTVLFFLSKRQTAQIQDTAFNYVLRGREFLDKGDEASAVAYFAAANKIFPSCLARGNAAWHMPPMPKAFFAHDGPLVAIAYSPDGKTLLTAGGTTGATLWNAETGQALSRPLKRDAVLTAAAFSRDGSKLALGWDNGEARVFDVATHAPVGRMMGQNKAINSVDFNDDGRRVLTSGMDGKAREWNATTGLALSPVMEHDQPILKALFSPDGTRVLTLDKGGSAQLWNADNGNSIGDSIQVDVKGEPSWYKPMVAFNPNGRGFLAAGWNGAVKFYDNRGKHSGAVIFMEGLGAQAVYSPDGSRVLASVINGGSAGLAKVYNARSHAPLKFSLKTGGRITTLAFSADGREVLAGTTDHLVRIWDAQTGQPLGHEYWQGDAITAAAFDPLGRTLAAGGKDGLACLWDLPLDGKKYQTSLAWVSSGRGHLKKPQSHALFSPDLKKILTFGGKTACLWNAITGKGEGGILEAGGSILRAVFSPDGTELLTCETDRQARLWNLSTGHFKSLGQGKAVEGGAFSFDGKTILTGGDDKTLRQWDAESGQQKGKPLSVGFSISKALISAGGENIAALGGNGNLKLYTTETKGPKLLMKVEKTVHDAVFSGDGRNLVYAAGKTAVVVEAKTGKPLRILDHGAGLTSVLVSPDSRTIATLGSDGTIRLWDLSTGLSVGNSLRHDGPVEDWAFSPHGDVLLAAYEDGGWEFWDTRTGEPIGEEEPLGVQAKALGFEPDGETARMLGKEGELVQKQLDWMDPKTDPNNLVLISEVSGRLRVDSQGSLEAVNSDQWVRLWAQYRKDNK
jgi:WD40 repeat protein/serine/threonine protein kinase